MRQLPEQSWAAMQHIQELRFPGRLSVNMHWLPMMCASEAVQTSKAAYADVTPGSPLHKAVLLLPEVDDPALCRRIA